jgi:hypothetical protein
VDNLTPTGRILAWTSLALLSALFVVYVPSVFGLGHLDGRTLFLPLFGVSFVSGICFARRRRILAFWIVGVMLAGLVLLDVRAIWLVE